MSWQASQWTNKGIAKALSGTCSRVTNFQGFGLFGLIVSFLLGVGALILFLY